MTPPAPGARLLRDAIGWGLALWAVGYVLGIALFFVLPVALLGWAILPVGVALTVWVLLRLPRRGAGEDLVLAIAWCAIAVLLDYVFIVRLLRPADGYYKADVYLYYALTFALPLVVGWARRRAR